MILFVRILKNVMILSYYVIGGQDTEECYDIEILWY